MTNFDETLRVAAYDCETHLIEPGLLAPPLVCMSTAEHGRGLRAPSALYHRSEAALVYNVERIHAEYDLVAGANTAFDAAVIMEAHPHTAPTIFKAYAEDRVLDVQYNEKLLDIAKGRLGLSFKGGVAAKKSYSLASLVKTYLEKDRDAQKSDPDGWRMRYRELHNVPLRAWPAAARDYAIEDSDDTLDVLDAQFLPERLELWQPVAAQVARTYLALHLVSAWGIKTCPEGIDALERITKSRFDELTAMLVKEGLVSAKGSRVTKKAKARLVAAYRELGVPWPLTDTGIAFARYLKNPESAKEKDREKFDARLRDEPRPADAGPELTDEERLEFASLDAESCEGSGDEVLEAYAERTSRATVVGTHIPDLRKGLVTPLQARWDIAKTMRITCQKGKGGSTDGFQLTNPARAIMMVCPECHGYSKRPEAADCERCESKGEVPGPGVRECFRARPGFVYIDADFSGLELCTVAQVCKILVGYSTLGDAINAGLDPHLALGVEIMNLIEGTSYSYEYAVEHKHEKRFKYYRQLAKPANFGFPGGLGAASFVGFAAGYGVRITIAQAKQIKEAWIRRWPEFVHYFRLISDGCDLLGHMTIEHLFDGHIRGEATYTKACNSNFQGLGARGATAALFEVSRRCYDPSMGSILFGSRPVNFPHDQIIAETPLARAPEAAVELGRVMVEACNVYLPDYPVSVEPHLSLVWSKDAEPLYDAPPKEGGRLVVWDTARDTKARVFRGNGKQVEWAA